MGVRSFKESTRSAMKQTKKYSYSSAEGFKTFELPIKLSTDFCLFFSATDLPEELVRFSTEVITKRCKFSSFDDLNEKILKVIADFEAQFVEETKKKVILYHIEYVRASARDDQRIYFNFQVAHRIDTGKETRYYQERLIRGRSPRTELEELNTYQIVGDHRSEPSEMLWTAERELWFTEMQSSLHKLGQQLIEGFGTKPEILARKIDQGGLKQLIASKEE